MHSAVLERHGAKVTQLRVASSRIVEALDVVEQVSACRVAGAEILRAVRSVFSDEKKLAIAELSQTFPARLIEQVMPLSSSRRWNCSMGILRSPVRTMQQRVSLAAAPDGHHERVHDQ